MVGPACSPTCTAYVDMTLTRSKVKVKVTGLLNFRQLAKPCMQAAMTAAPLRGFLVLFYDLYIIQQKCIKLHVHVYNNAVVKCHWATVCKTVRPMLSDRCQSVCLYVGILWPNGCIDQDVTWYGGRLRRRPHCVRWGPERGTPAPPHFSAVGTCLLWPNGRTSR